MALDDGAARERARRVGALLERVESLPDAAARAAALELVRTCLELYGEGLARVMRHAGGVGGGTLAEALAADELVSHLLLLHGLHPLDARARIARALAALEPRLRALGARAELLGVEGGTARLRLRAGGCGGAGAAGAARAAVETAVTEAAPEIERVEIAEPAPEPALIPAERLFQAPPRGPSTSPTPTASASPAPPTGPATGPPAGSAVGSVTGSARDRDPFGVPARTPAGVGNGAPAGVGNGARGAGVGA